MKIEFSNADDYQKFTYKLAEKRELIIDGEKFLMLDMSGGMTSMGSYFRQYSVELTLVHEPKRVKPEWSFGEQYLKDLRQKHSSLLKFTEQAIELFISSGDAERYLEKYNRDGTEK